MKLTQLAVAATAALSLGALATAAHARGDSQAQRGAEQSQARQGQTQAGGEQGQAHAQSAERSDVVKQVQQKLAAEGHEVGPADGILGPKTKQGLKEFQQSKGLEATGQLNQQTLAALDIQAASIGGTSGMGATGATGGGNGSMSRTGSSAASSQRPAGDASSQSGNNKVR